MPFNCACFQRDFGRNSAMPKTSLMRKVICNIPKAELSSNFNNILAYLTSSGHGRLSDRKSRLLKITAKSFWGSPVGAFAGNKRFDVFQFKKDWWFYLFRLLRNNIIIGAMGREVKNTFLSVSCKSKVSKSWRQITRHQLLDLCAIRPPRLPLFHRPLFLTWLSACTFDPCQHEFRNTNYRVSLIRFV